MPAAGVAHERLAAQRARSASCARTAAGLQLAACKPGRPCLQLALAVTALRRRPRRWPASWRSRRTTAGRPSASGSSAAERSTAYRQVTEPCAERGLHHRPRSAHDSETCRPRCTQSPAMRLRLAFLPWRVCTSSTLIPCCQQHGLQWGRIKLLCCHWPAHIVRAGLVGLCTGSGVRLGRRAGSYARRSTRLVADALMSHQH